eukprot:9369292-Lingulodinium_polyedra.AAC.1
MVKNGTRLALMPLPKASQQEDPAKQPVSGSGKGATAELWKSCQNKLHISTVILLDAAVRRKAYIIGTLGKHLKLWQGNCAKEVRSPE